MFVVESWQQNGLNFRATIRPDNHWLVWCSFSPLSGVNPVEEAPEKTVWFKRSQRKDDAVTNLLREVYPGDEAANG